MEGMPLHRLAAPARWFEECSSLLVKSTNGVEEWVVFSVGFKKLLIGFVNLFGLSKWLILRVSDTAGFEEKST